MQRRQHRLPHCQFTTCSTLRPSLLRDRAVAVLERRGSTFGDLTITQFDDPLLTEHVLFLAVVDIPRHISVSLSLLHNWLCPFSSQLFTNYISLSFSFLVLLPTHTHTHTHTHTLTHTHTHTHTPPPPPSPLLVDGGVLHSKTDDSCVPTP